MAIFNGFVLVSTVVLMVFLIGLHTYLTNYEENGCNMTYLFEYPQFVRISLPYNVSVKYKRYGLYAFAEGKFIEKVRAMKFKGIPVLFIPGSRGSSKQVRSLASISLRKALGNKLPFSFDYFTIDLDGDQSGLFGGVLVDQTNFVKLSIEKIISLYKLPNPPNSVILIGHSMGGLVAKGLFLDPDFNMDRVKVILTLATPHSPAILPDYLLAQYYDKVTSFWENNKGFRKKLTLISIGGGQRDLIVKSGLTVTPHADINVISSSVSDVWVSVDHYCILWCKELVLVLVRALFDCVDITTKQITNDVQLRREIFKYHLIERSGGKKYIERDDVSVLWDGVSHPGVWATLHKDQYTWKQSKGVPVPTFITVPLATVADTLIIQAINHQTSDWLFTCRFDHSLNTTKICKTAENLSSQGRISPTKGMKRKVALLDLSKLRMDGNTHVVIRTLPTNEPVELWFELVKRKNRTLVGSAFYLKPTTLLEDSAWTLPGSTFFSVEVPSIQRVWHIHRLQIESPDCLIPNLAQVNVKVPWNNEGTTHLISGQRGSVPIIIHTPKPTGKEYKDVTIDLILNPECSYTVRLEKPLLQGLGAVIGRSGVGMVSSVAVCLLMTLASQIKSLQESSHCRLLHFIMPVAARPYYILPAFSISSSIARYLPSLIPQAPLSDVQLNSGLMDALFIPLFLHCSAFALTYILGIGILISVIFYGQAFNNVILRFVNKFVFGLTWISEYIVGGINKLSILVSAFLVLLTFSACGGLALCVGLVLYFFKLVSLYEDFWQEVVYWPLRLLKARLFKKKSTEDAESEPMPQFCLPSTTDISFHLTLLMLWALTALVSIPSLLVWANNYRYSTRLDPDPFFVHGLAMSLCTSFLWQSGVPKTNLVWSKQLSQMIFGSSVLIMVYAQISLYRLDTILVGVFLAVTLHQGIAPWFTKETESVSETKTVTDDVDRQIERALEATAPIASFTKAPLLEADFPKDQDAPLVEGKSESSEEEEDEDEEQSDHSSRPTSENTDFENNVDEEFACEISLEDGSGQEACSITEKTPSSDVSSSSFENISLKDVKD